ncbi:MAG TPA: PaaI family thioesterase [Thermoanaerobaculia bacterium]|nr:PaaI family thioesterase [Thermoanaerobaculia bacterium]
MTFLPQDPDFEAKTRAAFAGQPFMATIGAEMVRVAPGEVDIALPFRADLTQHHGYLHAGVVTALVDTACGFAAFTLMPAGSGVVSVEYKVNLMAPAVGERMLARGRVLRAGWTLTVCTGEVVALTGNEETTVTAMLATMMRLASV